MTPDSATPEPSAPGPDWSLPSVVELRIEHIRFEPPPLKHFVSAYAQFDEGVEAVELRAVLDGPIPARAMPAVLFVGDTPVFLRAVDGDVHRFATPRPHTLRRGAHITFGWLHDSPNKRNATGFRYDP